VLGGFGKSGASDKAPPISDYANNDGWFDDVSDGPVTAEVTLKGGRQLTATPSWVIVGPPDFSPPTRHFVNFSDIGVEAAISRGFAAAGAAILHRDIYRPWLAPWTCSGCRRTPWEGMAPIQAGVIS
jgi:hypothetical protein